MLAYSRYSRYRTKTHDKSTISHDIPRYLRYQTVLSKLEEIIKYYQKDSDYFGVFLHILGCPPPSHSRFASFDALSPKTPCCGRFDYMLSRLFWCKNGATLCAMIFTISHDTARKRTKSLRYRTLFTIFNAIYAMSITTRDNFCLSATLKNPDTIKVFGVFFLPKFHFGCKFGAS